MLETSNNIHTQSNVNKSYTTNPSQTKKASNNPSIHNNDAKTINNAGNAGKTKNAGHLLNRIETANILNRIETANISLNMAAKKIRETGDALDNIIDNIDNIEAELNKIVKQFPPFPPGSEDRVRILKNINAFRKQIDQLTIPPEQNIKNIIEETNADTSVGIEMGRLVLLFDKNKYQYTVKSLNDASIRYELNLLDLNEEPTDEKLSASLKYLDTAKNDLEIERKNLKYFASNLAELKIKSSFGKESGIDSIEENTAEQNSAKIGQYLAGGSNMGITLQKSSLKGLLI